MSNEDEGRDEGRGDEAAGTETDSREGEGGENNSSRYS